MVQTQGFAGEPLVSLGIRAEEGESITLIWEGAETVSGEVSLYDAVENRTTVLNEADSYTFTNGAESDNRFQLRFSPQAPTDTRQLPGDGLTVGCINRRIHAVSSSSDPIRSVSVYTLHGRLICSEANVSSSVFTGGKMDRGACLVKVETANSVKVKKIIVL
jgi:hypothetical protein